MSGENVSESEFCPILKSRWSLPVRNKRLCIDSQDVSVPLPEPWDTRVLQIMNLRVGSFKVTFLNTRNCSPHRPGRPCPPPGLWTPCLQCGWRRGCWGPGSVGAPDQWWWPPSGSPGVWWRSSCVMCADTECLAVTEASVCSLHPASTRL